MKVALITGASGGIGGETVKTFVKNGYFAIGLYNRGEKEIEILKNSLKAEGLSDYFAAYKCDFKSETEIYSVIQKISVGFRHIDALINNAGVDLYRLITDTTEKEWDDVFAVNTKSAFIFTKYALKSMIERGSGAIVNVSSVWGVSGAAMETVYSASKAALIGLTKATAKEVAASGVRVNCVCPGVIDTKMNDCFSAQEKEEIISRIPLSRLGSSAEIAELIFFLCSKKAGYITGQAINIDGGFLL